MTATQEEVHSEVPSDAETESQGAEARPRATSVPTSLHEVTERSRWARLTGFQAKAQAAAAGVTSGASLLHARPPSLAESRQRHHVAAGHFEAGLLRWPRLAWGYCHLALKALLHVIEWVTESPPRFCTAIILIVVLKVWG